MTDPLPDWHLRMSDGLSQANADLKTMKHTIQAALSAPDERESLRDAVHRLETLMLALRDKIHALHPPPQG